MNTFEALSHDIRKLHALTDTRNLALAFLASNGGKDELYACLRLLDRLGGHAGGHYACYLDGCPFDINTGSDRKIVLADLEGDVWNFYCDTFREEAREFLGA